MNDNIDQEDTSLITLNEIHQRRARPYVFSLFIVVALYTLIGVIAYHLFTGWSDLDAVYFSVITLATVGQ